MTRAIIVFVLGIYRKNPKTESYLGLGLGLRVTFGERTVYFRLKERLISVHELLTFIEAVNCELLSI